jgi:hypothetical protein
MSRPHGVICYWNFVPSKTKYHEDCKWELAESFTIDCDGHCLTTPSTGGGDRHEWHKWTNEPVYFLEEYEDDAKSRGWFTKSELEAIGKTTDDASHDDHKPIMGRAVTLWEMGHGVQLMDFHPPEWATWLSTSFYEELRKLPNWSTLIEKGYDLYFGTINEAHRYITFDETKKPEEEGAKRGKRKR